MADTPTVDQAWNAVKKDVGAIRKDERNQSQGFNFRGVDTVVNAVATATQKHGVNVIPTPVDIQFHDYQTSRGTAMRNATVKMAYTIRGPAGDTIVGGAYGEASDAGDKAVSKAQSVAYRVFLLQALTAPTDDPDPDSESHERAPSTRRAATSAPPPSEGVQAFAAAANALDGSQRAELRTRLLAAGLPGKASDMNAAQQAEALLILNEMAA